jgi:hypothetical protein
MAGALQETYSSESDEASGYLLFAEQKVPSSGDRIGRGWIYLSRAERASWDFEILGLHRAERLLAKRFRPDWTKV